MKNINNNQKGSSLLLTVLIMAAIVSIAIGVSRLSLREIVLTRDVSKSLIAYYAAEAGIEAAIFYDRSVVGGDSSFTLSDCLNSDTCYEVEASGISPNRTIRSRGTYQDIERAVELTF